MLGAVVRTASESSPRLQLCSTSFRTRVSGRSDGSWASIIFWKGGRRYGRRIRLAARLITTRDQANIWAGTYEVQLPPVFSLQQSLAQRVAESLAAQLHLTPTSGWHRAIPHSAPAYDAYIEGRSFYLPTDEDIKKSSSIST